MYMLLTPRQTLGALVTIDVHNRDVVVGLEVEIQHIVVAGFNSAFSSAV